MPTLLLQDAWTVNSSASEDSSDEDLDEPGATPRKRKKMKTKQRKKIPTAADFFTVQSSPTPPPTSTPESPHTDKAATVCEPPSSPVHNELAELVCQGVACGWCLSTAAPDLMIACPACVALSYCNDECRKKRWPCHWKVCKLMKGRTFARKVFLVSLMIEARPVSPPRPSSNTGSPPRSSSNTGPPPRSSSNTVSPPRQRAVEIPNSFPQFIPQMEGCKAI